MLINSRLYWPEPNADEVRLILDRRLLELGLVAIAPNTPDNKGGYLPVLPADSGAFLTEQEYAALCAGNVEAAAEMYFVRTEPSSRSSELALKGKIDNNTKRAWASHLGNRFSDLIAELQAKGIMPSPQKKRGLFG